MIFQDQLQESPQEVEKTVQALSTTLHPRFTCLSPSLSLSLSLTVGLFLKYTLFTFTFFLSLSLSLKSLDILVNLSLLL